LYETRFSLGLRPSGGGLRPRRRRPAAHDGQALLQHRLGHANAALTLNTYSHLFEAADRDLADALEGTGGVT
jgi:integrase